MTTPTLSDLRFLFYGGGSAAEYDFLQQAFALGISAVDLLGLVGGSGAYALPTDIAESRKIGAEAFPRYQELADGTHQWGPGTGATDTTLYRQGNNTLGTSSSFIGLAEFFPRYGQPSQLKLGGVGPGGEAGIIFGNAGDTNLYRVAANALQTDDDFRSLLNIIAQRNTAAQVAIGNAGPSAESGISFQNGETSIYRASSNSLRTDGFLNSGTQITAKVAGSSKTVIGDVGPASESCILFGSAGDTNLYRSAADTLKTDDKFIATGSIQLNGGWLIGRSSQFSGGVDVITACLTFGSGAPNNTFGNNGDIYLRTDGGALTTIYQRRAGAWVGIV